MDTVHLLMSSTWLQADKAVLVQAQVVADMLVPADLKDSDIDHQTATAL
jgi:hypothetical protein